VIRGKQFSGVPSWTACLVRPALRALVAVGFALGLCRPLAAQDDLPPIVRHALATYVAEHRGNLAFSRHLTFQLHVGPISRDVRNEVGILMHNGEYVRTKYYSAETNGKAEGDADLQRDEERANDDLASGRGFFKRPVDPHFVDDYRFEPADCDCPRSVDAIRFTSTVRDAQHGDGVVRIEKASGRVVSIEYAMNKPPDHASQGRVVETYGDALPDLWTCVAVEETYSGRVGFVGGSATLHYTFDHFRRFSEQTAAIAALTKGLP
jgi:hypothetical protein